LGAVYKRGQAPPEFIANAPALLPGLELYYEAFKELSTCRPYIGLEGVPGPIPWTAIDRYGLAHGFEEEGLDYLVKMIRALDDEFLVYMRKANGGGKPGTIQQEDRNAGEAGG
jgi:hypothetical protein